MLLDLASWEEEEEEEEGSLGHSPPSFSYSIIVGLADDEGGSGGWRRGSPVPSLSSSAGRI